MQAESFSSKLSQASGLLTGNFSNEGDNLISKEASFGEEASRLKSWVTFLTFLNGSLLLLLSIFFLVTILLFLLNFIKYDSLYKASGMSIIFSWGFLIPMIILGIVVIIPS